MNFNKDDFLFEIGEWFLYRFFNEQSEIAKQLALKGIIFLSSYIGIPIEPEFEKRILHSNNIDDDKLELSLLLNLNIPEKTIDFLKDLSDYNFTKDDFSDVSEFYTPEILEALRQTFLEESTGIFVEIINVFSKKKYLKEDIYKLYKAAHTLKGSSATVGLGEISQSALFLEKYLHNLHDTNAQLSVESTIIVICVFLILELTIYKQNTKLLHKIKSLIDVAKTFDSTNISVTTTSHSDEQKPNNSSQKNYINEIVDKNISKTEEIPQKTTKKQTSSNVENKSLSSSSENDMYLILKEVFKEEADEHLAKLDLKLEQLKQGKEETLYELFRITHTLKGAAGTVGLQFISEAAHKLESFFEDLHQSHKFPTGQALESVCYAGALLRKSVENQKDLTSEIDKIIKEIKSLMEKDKNSSKIIQNSEQNLESEQNSLKIDKKSKSIRNFLKIPTDDFDKLVSSSEDMVFVRTQFEKSRDEFFSIKSDLQLSYRTLRNFILEDRKKMSEAERQERITEIEVEISEIINNLEHSVSAMSKQCLSFNSGTQQLQEMLMNFRVTNLKLVFMKLKSAIREYARQTGKQINYKLIGDSVELDKQVVDNLSVPLIQIVRNAIAHGIETPNERMKKGKPKEGLIQVTARKNGNFVDVVISDDGAGIDTDNIRRILKEKKFIDTNINIDELSREEILESIFFAGFTTKSEATDLAGRGVGLDLVRQQIYKLGGEISVTTKQGEGTTFYIKVPVTTFVSQVLLFRMGGEIYGVPIRYATEIIEYPNVQRIMPGKRIIWNKHSIPIVPLHYYFSINTSSYNGGMNSFIIVLTHGDKYFGITADKLIGIKDVSVKNLGSILLGLKFFSGAVVSGAGTIQMILNIPYMALLARSSLEFKIRKHTKYKKKVPKLLVCDDSKSVREAVIRVLSEQGYDIVTAQDGWEAWNLLHEEYFDLLLTDLEMPRMNGYELIAEVNRDSYLSQIPVVVLSSRTGETSLNKVKVAGKARFISKPVKPLLLRKIVNDYVPIKEELMSDKIILFATTNQDKMKELKDLIKNLPIEVWGLEHFRGIDEVKEIGKTFEENAILKAKSRFVKTGIPTIADDSGLEVEALNGEPGVLSARYAGEDATDSMRIEYLLKKMKNITNRKARFVTVIAFYYDLQKEPIIVKGICEGEIALKSKGNMGFGYDPIFVLPSGKTMAELTLEEKNEISHRSHAFNQLLPFLENFAS